MVELKGKELLSARAMEWTILTAVRTSAGQARIGTSESGHEQPQSRVAMRRWDFAYTYEKSGVHNSDALRNRRGGR
jgi:hypothetical protein